MSTYLVESFDSTKHCPPSHARLATPEEAAASPYRAAGVLAFQRHEWREHWLVYEGEAQPLGFYCIHCRAVTD